MSDDYLGAYGRIVQGREAVRMINDASQLLCEAIAMLNWLREYRVEREACGSAVDDLGLVARSLEVQLDVFVADVDARYTASMQEVDDGSE